MHPLEELAALGALDHAVVVSGSQGGDLRHAELGDPSLAGTLELGRVVDAAHAEDHPLARHQAGHRMGGAQAAGVGEAGRGAGEVVDGDFGLAGALDEALVRRPERGEVEAFAVLDVGHQQLPGAVRLGHVDRQAEVDRRRGDQGRLAVAQLVAVVHRRLRDQGLDHREANEMGEGDFAAGRPREVAVDEQPLLDGELHGHVADGCRGGNLQRGFHVGDRPHGGAAQDGVGRLAGLHDLLADNRTVGRQAETRAGAFDRVRPRDDGLDRDAGGGVFGGSGDRGWDDRLRRRDRLGHDHGPGRGGRSGGSRCGCDRRRKRWSGRSLRRSHWSRGARMLLKVSDPAGINGGGIVGVLLVHLLDQPIVGAKNLSLA